MVNPAPKNQHLHHHHHHHPIAQNPTVESQSSAWKHSTTPGNKSFPNGRVVRGDCFSNPGDCCVRPQCRPPRPRVWRSRRGLHSPPCVELPKSKPWPANAMSIGHRQSSGLSDVLWSGWGPPWYSMPGEAALAVLDASRPGSIPHHKVEFILNTVVLSAPNSLVVDVKTRRVAQSSQIIEFEVGWALCTTWCLDSWEKIAWL